MLMPILAPPYGVVTSGLALHISVLSGSYPGSGQSLTDLGPNGWGMYLGETSGADASDPTYAAGPPAHLTLDGGDWLNTQASLTTGLPRTMGQTGVEFTVECWVKIGSAAGAAIVGNKNGLGGGNGFSLEIVAAGNDYFVFYGGSNIQTTVASTYPTGSWVHLAYTGNPNGAVTCRLYEQAVEIFTHTPNNSAFSSGDSTDQLHFGARGNMGAPMPTSSALSVLRLYSRALTAAEISRNFTVERGKFGV